MRSATTPIGTDASGAERVSGGRGPGTCEPCHNDAVSTFRDYVDTFDTESGYLNWAAFGPLSPSVREEVFADADMLGSGRPSSLSLVAERIGQAQELVAELLDAEADDVTLQPSSTHGLMHALFGLSGDVIASTAEFPSVSLTLERASTASDRTVAPRWITPDDGRVTPDTVIEALDDEVVALAVSHVDFRTGFRVDLAALRESIGPDRLLIVDAVQSFGVIDADYSAADVVVGHGYKWLRAGRGSAFAWFSPRARERITPVLSGITGTTAAGLFVDELPAPAPSARAFTVSQPDTLAAGRLAIGVRDVRDAGVVSIEERLAQNVEHRDRDRRPPRHRGELPARAQPACGHRRARSGGARAARRGTRQRRSGRHGTGRLGADRTARGHRRGDIRAPRRCAAGVRQRDVHQRVTNHWRVEFGLIARTVVRSRHRARRPFESASG